MGNIHGVDDDGQGDIESESSNPFRIQKNKKIEEIFEEESKKKEKVEIDIFLDKKFDKEVKIILEKLKFNNNNPNIVKSIKMKKEQIEEIKCARLIGYKFWGDANVFIHRMFDDTREQSYLHNKCSEKLRRMNIIFTLPIIFVASITTGLAYFSVGDESDDSESQYNISITLAVLTSFLTVLGGISSLLSFTDRHSSHEVAASSYDRLNHLIENTFVLPGDLKKHNEIAFTHISDEYSRLKTTSPQISNIFC